MKLYAKNDYTIDVYDFVPNKEKIAEYKEKEMKSISDERRIYKAVSYDERPLLLEKDVISSYEAYHQGYGINGGLVGHTLLHYSISNKDKSNQLELLNKYYNGEFDNKKIVKVEDVISDIYLLLTDDYHHEDYNLYNPYAMENIISLPRSLYLLQLILQRDIVRIGNIDITEQLKLFEIKQMNTFSIQTLKELYETELIPGTFECVMQEVENSQKILKKVL